MDTPEKPRRPWWRRKRWWAVAAFWLLFPVWYALSSGPAWCCVSHDWISRGDFLGIYGPMWRTADRSPPAIRAAFHGYLGWWGKLGFDDPALE